MRHKIGRWWKKNVVGESPNQDFARSTTAHDLGATEQSFELPEAIDAQLEHQTLSELGMGILEDAGTSLVTGVLQQTLKHILEFEKSDEDLIT